VRRRSPRLAKVLPSRSTHSSCCPITACDLEPAAGRLRFFHALAANQEPFRASVAGAAQRRPHNALRSSGASPNFPSNRPELTGRSRCSYYVLMKSSNRKHRLPASVPCERAGPRCYEVRQTMALGWPALPRLPREAANRGRLAFSIIRLAARARSLGAPAIAPELHSTHLPRLKFESASNGRIAEVAIA
jgi:hypothetical protein